MRNKTLIRLGAALALLSMLAGCGPAAEPTPSPSAPAAEVTPEIQAELDAQLGLLTGYITEEERQAALDLWLQIRPLREARLAAGQWAWRPRETTLLTELSALYDQYTIKYLGGDEAGFGYTNPEQTTLISYTLGADGTLIADPSTAGQLTGWTEEELMVCCPRGPLPTSSGSPSSPTAPMRRWPGSRPWTTPATPGRSRWTPPTRETGATLWRPSSTSTATT